MDKIGKMIAERRCGLGISQARLAHGAGVSLRTIQRIESGVANPRIKTIQALVKALMLSYIKVE